MLVVYKQLQDMFETLGVLHVIELWTYLLLEMKVIIHSTRPGLLAKIADGYDNQYLIDLSETAL